MKAILRIGYTVLVMDVELATGLFQKLSMQDGLHMLDYDYKDNKRLEYLKAQEISLEVCTDERFAMAKLNTAARVEPS
jgi:hypothetical protein